MKKHVRFKIKQFAEKVASSIFEVEEIDKEYAEHLIKIKLEEELFELIKAFSSSYEAKYIELVEQMSSSNLNIKDKKYFELGREIAFYKNRKLASNRAQNELQRESKYKKMKQFIIDRLGIDAYTEFTESLNNN
jgi:hypothetical protein